MPKNGLHARAVLRRKPPRRSCLWKGALTELARHSCPGNVREQRNVVQRRAIEAEWMRIEAEECEDISAADRPMVARESPLTPSELVRQTCITMKTATVRDLRNHFASVAKWIEHGEPVTITRNGTAFATLAPAAVQKPHKVDWAARVKRYKPVGRKLSKAEIEAFWSSLRD